uniref:Uncharacterized protein n=1 Tax=Oryza brachyantha TaxID=4533 RepID=J3N8H2_ORYBR
MKLLGWMHRKLRSNNDVFKEFNTGGGGACNCITALASPDADHEYFAGDEAFDAAHASPAVTAGDLFTLGGSGLLTIGTLGIAAVAIPGDIDDDDYDVDDIDFEVEGSNCTVGDDADGAVTPTFTFPVAAAEAASAVATVEKAVAAVEAIAEKDDDTTTEDDLMVVSAELEKVLGGDVASARVSFAMGVDCPLQGFLFGSPVSDVESRPDQPPRESYGGGRRTSLGELFMRTRFAEEKVALVAVEEGEDGFGDGAAAGADREEGRAGKGDGGGGHKMMKKRRVKDEKGGGGGGTPATVTKSKFQKILQIFHRKVYPENTLLTRNLTKKSHRKRGDSSDNNNGGGGAAGPGLGAGIIMWFRGEWSSRKLMAILLWVPPLIML